MARRTGTFGEVFDPIPRIIHQTWKSEQVPDAWLHYQDSWRRSHPGWEYVLWTDAANRRLIADQHPWFLPVYDAFPRDIQRVDAAKYFILYTHGGVYADLDCECVKPLDPILSRGGAIVCRTTDGVIDGATMASQPGHPFWKVVFAHLQAPPLGARLLRGAPGFNASYVLMSTGPRMLARAVRDYLRAISLAPDGTPAMTILPPACFSGRSWLDRHEAFRAGPDAYVRHHYSDSWLQPAEQRVVRWFTRRKLRWAFALAVLAAVILTAAR